MAGDSISASGTRSWLFICMLNCKPREIGLGSTLDVTLAKARERTARQLAVGKVG